MAYFSGDTIKVKGTFKDLSGTLVDADALTTVYLTIFNEGRVQLDQFTCTKDSTGVYSYNWTLPANESVYILEIKGTFNSKIQLARSKVSVKFR